MRQSAKALLDMCLKRMPGTKYDKFYCEELIKKVKTTEKMQEITEKLAAVPESEPVPAVVEKFLEIVANITKTAEQLRQDAVKKEEKKQEELKKSKEA